MYTWSKPLSEEQQQRLLEYRLIFRGTTLEEITDTLNSIGFYGSGFRRGRPATSFSDDPLNAAFHGYDKGQKLNQTPVLITLPTANYMQSITHGIETREFEVHARIKKEDITEVDSGQKIKEIINEQLKRDWEIIYGQDVEELLEFILRKWEFHGFQ